MPRTVKPKTTKGRKRKTTLKTSTIQKAVASVVVNIDKRRRGGQSTKGVPQRRPSDLTTTLGFSGIRDVTRPSETTSNLKAQAKLLKAAIDPLIQQVNMQNLAISDVQNTLLDDALRRNVSLLQSNLNQPSFKSGGGFSPTGELTPSTGILQNVEKAKNFLKKNVEHMPKLSTGKGKSRNYTAGEIDKMQTNRLLQLYEQTKQNIQQLSADEVMDDPEIGYTTPPLSEDEKKLKKLQELYSSGKKISKEQREWMRERGYLELLADIVPEQAYKTD